VGTYELHSPQGSTDIRFSLHDDWSARFESDVTCSATVASRVLSNHRIRPAIVTIATRPF